MKFRHLILPALLLFTSCAVYKQLTPQPALSPAEQGFIELKKKEADFILKKDKKYFISFPAPAEDNFYLVLDIKGNDQLRTVFTPDLVKKKAYSTLIKDETRTPKTSSVYALGTDASEYFWLIDAVLAEEVHLNLKYRYVPQWRFTFENEYATFKTVLEKNKLNRTIYTTLGTSYHFNDFNFSQEITTLESHQVALHTVRTKLLAIESIFPKSIANSSDKAYQNYITLKKEVDDELTFLRNYAMVLAFFHTGDKVGAEIPQFIENVKAYTIYFREGKHLPQSIIQESQRMIQPRVVAVAPFINGLISAKKDRTPLDNATYFLQSYPLIDSLCTTAGISFPADMVKLTRFTADYNKATTQLDQIIQTHVGIIDAEQKQTDMPADTFFTNLVTKSNNALEALPLPLGKVYGFYANFKTTKKLNKAITATSKELNALLYTYRQAADLVPRLNTHKAQKNYRAMIALLNRNRQLNLLTVKYAPLDAMSVDKQVADIKTSLDARKWQTSEQLLTDLHTDRTFMDPASITQKKRSAVLQAEDALYSGIDKLSREKILAFVAEKVNELEDVDGLYADSVFMPAYDVRFSSGSQKHLQEKKQDLITMLAKMKENEFPAKAITLLYKEFLNTPKDNGVLKARAVVSHGKHYLGSDQKLRIKIAECDPYSAKRIRKAKQYRRVFALPVTDNRSGGVNRYFCRFNLDVPSKAKFPVWDVTIKLPKAIAGKAGSEKWYEKITLNKKLLKNEGRFSISAPNSDNNYECQITPVQTKKGRRNVLDVFFKHPSFKAHQISVMVQKPIIKKN